MDKTRILKEYEFSGNAFAEKVKSFFATQIEVWPLAKKNYFDLKSIEKKVFEFDGFKIVVQYNPGRIVSSSAKVDVKSIEKRPCFLCNDNLPHEQKVLTYKNEYNVLVNPFPIFDEHFTIPTFKHQPQKIIDSFSAMMDMAKDLGLYYTMFYNGPKCGASAPDHLHFQACLKDIMPIENELSNTVLIKGTSLFKSSETKVFSVTDYLRNFFLIESQTKEAAMHHFNKLVSSIAIMMKTNEEPMLNIIMTFQSKWKILVFPRENHRPSQYFLKGKERMLISPAAVDFGGQIITPREEDFKKITKENISDIFSQTSVSENKLERISKGYIKSIQQY